MCYLTWQKRLLQYDYVKGLEVKRWSWVYLGRPNWITKVLKRVREREERAREDVSRESEVRAMQLLV